MADNKDIRDGRDRSQVDRNDPNEIQYIADKYGVSIEDIKAIISRAGNNSRDIENELESEKNND